jgi:hypothetical protein
VPAASAVSRGRRTALAAFAAYAAISFLYLGLPAVVGSGTRYVGRDYNPQIFIWAFAWWPHAILHGWSPFVTDRIWAPEGVNTMWSTTVPGLALLFAPLTLVFGAIHSYDVAAVLAPALSAWTAFLLCRYLTRSFWPSLVGGYLFGFSSFVLGQEGGGGNVNLGAAFLLPLAALVVLRRLDGGISARGLVVRLGPVLALQFLISVEVALTLTLALAVSLAVAYAVAPTRRRSVIRLLGPVALAYCAAGVIVAPFLYYLLDAYPQGPFYAPDQFIADLANLVVPTRITAIGGSWLTGVSSRFPGNLGEQGAYLGLPTLLIVVLYARDRIRTAGGRFLLVVFVLAVVVALGGRGTVAGRDMVSMPWALVESLPSLRNVLTARFAAYIALAAAVVVALWTASRTRGALRWILPGLAVIAVAPNPRGFATRYHVPSYFTASAYRTCLDPGETVLPLPIRGGNSLLWQTADGFRFKMAGGDIGPDIPGSFFVPPLDQVAGGQPLRASQVDALRAYVAAKHVTTIVVDGSRAADFAPAVDRIAKPKRVGGVLVYHLERFPPPC